MSVQVCLLSLDLSCDLPSDLPDETAHLPELNVIQSKLDCTLAAVKSAGNCTLQTNSGLHESSSSASKGSFSDSTIVVEQASLDLPGTYLIQFFALNSEFNKHF